ERSSVDDAQRRIDGAQYAVQIVATLEDAARGGDHRIGALAAGEAGILDDAIERHFRRTAADCENGAVLEKLNGVIAPFAGGDLLAIKTQDAVQFAPLERDPGIGRLKATAAASAAARERYRIEIAHGASLSMAFTIE